MDKGFDIAFPKLKFNVLDCTFGISLKFGVVESKFRLYIVGTDILRFHLEKNNIKEFNINLTFYCSIYYTVIHEKA